MICSTLLCVCVYVCVCVCVANCSCRLSREVVQRLQMVIASSDSSGSSHPTTSTSSTSSLTAPGSPPDQSPLEKLLLGVLRHLTSSALCLEGILESTQQIGFSAAGGGGGGGGGSIVQEFMELFLALPSLLPRTAGQLVQVMVPLLRCSSGLADRYMERRRRRRQRGGRRWK